MRKKRYGKDAWWLLCHLGDLMKTEKHRDSFPPAESYDKRRFKSSLRLINEGVLSIVSVDVDYQGRPRLYYTSTPDKIRRALNNGTPR